GTLSNAGILDATGTNALHHVGITNTNNLESTGGVLTIDARSTINNSGTLQANGGELDLTSDTVTNTGTLKATQSSTLELTSTTVTNTGGAVHVDPGAPLSLPTRRSSDLGTLSNAGILDATGTNALHHVGITNTNNLESTG